VPAADSFLRPPTRFKGYFIWMFGQPLHLPLGKEGSPGAKSVVTFNWHSLFNLSLPFLFVKQGYLGVEGGEKQFETITQR
jgi:hypothetical protein